MAAACAFCDIVQGTTRAHVVLEDKLTVAFLDHRPVFKGHVLLAPREHVETLVELPSELLGPFFERAQRLARGVVEALAADGTFIAINNRVSQSVPHLHVHVVPRRRKDGLRGFFWPRTRYTGEAEMAEYAERIAGAIDN